MSLSSVDNKVIPPLPWQTWSSVHIFCLLNCTPTVVSTKALKLRKLVYLSSGHNMITPRKKKSLLRNPQNWSNSKIGLEGCRGRPYKPENERSPLELRGKKVCNASTSPLLHIIHNESTKKHWLPVGWCHWPQCVEGLLRMTTGCVIPCTLWQPLFKNSFHQPTTFPMKKNKGIYQNHSYTADEGTDEDWNSWDG